MNLTKLKEPFPARQIKWRVGATNQDKTQGLALAYIDARAVMNRLDNVLGSKNWQKKYNLGDNGEIICSIGIKVDGEWIWKSGGAGKTNFEAIKGGLSDAFKRAAVCWGIGRYLYSLPQQWVPIKQQGKNYVIKKEPELPPKFLPQNLIKKIRSIYQQNSVVAEEIIKQYLTEIDIEAKLSNVGRVNKEEAEELLKRLRNDLDVKEVA